MSVELESRQVGDVTVNLGWADDWFRCNYIEARTLFDVTLPQTATIYRHRFIDETVALPVDPGKLAARINRRSKRWSRVVMTVDAVASVRHRRQPVACTWKQTAVRGHVDVDVIGEMIDIDGQLVTVIRCRSCHRTATLTAELRRTGVVGAPFGVGGYLSPTLVSMLI